MEKHNYDAGLPATNAPFNLCVRYGDLIFVSGCRLSTRRSPGRCARPGTRARDSAFSESTLRRAGAPGGWTT